MIKKLVIKYYQRIRIKIFKNLSTCERIIGNPKQTQPVLFIGKGVIQFGSNVQIGYFPSPYYYTGNCHFEARTNESIINIGSDVYFNNNFVVISECFVDIGDNCLIGTNVEIYDSDFHNIDPESRLKNDYKCIAPVIIKNNVWLGSNVKVLKGVTIGINSVIANGAIVTRNIPDNVLAGGIPAKVIKQI